MKVALSVDALSPQLTGIGRYNWELVRGLARDQRVDELYSVHQGVIVPDPALLLLETSHRLPAGRRAFARLKARFMLRGSIFHGPNFFLPDHVEGGIVTVHDLSVLKYPETHPAERVLMFEQRFASSLRRAAHVLTDSEHGRAELMDWFGLAADQVTTVPLGVSGTFRPRTFAECAEVLRKYGIERGGYALCVATLEPRKGIPAAIGAFGLVERTMAKQPLVLVGAAGWNNSTLRDIIAREARNGTVLPLGYVAEEDLPYIYASAGLFLFPSIYEGFGFPPLEAMACGVPAIVSDRSCLPEITKGAAMYIDPDDLDGFARAIEKGMTDEQWRTEAIAAGLVVAGSYRWSRCCEETVSVYEKVGGFRNG